MLTKLVMLAAAQAATADGLIAGSHRVTQVAVQCPTQAEPDEVVVCGRRRADRYRLPLAIESDGGSRSDPTPGQREALLVPASKCAEKSPFLVGCGSVGIGIGLSGDGKTRIVGPRPLSP